MEKGRDSTRAISFFTAICTLESSKSSLLVLRENDRTMERWKFRRAADVLFSP